MRRKEQLIADARAEGKSADDAVAATEDAVLKDQLADTADANGGADSQRAELRLLKDLESSIETGFQLATFQGPLCAEPVVGMAWTVESIEIYRSEGDEEAGESAVHFSIGRGHITEYVLTSRSWQIVGGGRRPYLVGTRFLPTRST